MTFFEQMIMFIWISIVLGLGAQRVRELSDAATAQGKSIVEAIDRNTEAIKTQTNCCTPPTRGIP